MAFANMDERLANIIYNQQLQEKQALSELIDSYSVSNAATEFHRGLKELVRDHLNTCMAFTSCSQSNESITDTSNYGSNGIHRRRLKHVSERCNICQLRDLLQQDEESSSSILSYKTLHSKHSDRYKFITIYLRIVAFTPFISSVCCPWISSDHHFEHRLVHIAY